MADDLGSRLVAAGLVTREQLAQALAMAPPHGGALARELVRLGLEQDSLAGFFVADGYGPLMEASDLGLADPRATAVLAGPVADALLVLPLRSSPGGLIVAMADPSDRHALEELRFAVGRSILPTVARVRELERAIRETWPDLHRGRAGANGGSHGARPAGDGAGSTTGPRANGARLGVGEATPSRGRPAALPWDGPVPLVRRKRRPSPTHGTGPRQASSRTGAVPGDLPREETGSYELPRRRRGRPRRETPLPAGDHWGELDEAARRKRRSRPAPSAPPPPPTRWAFPPGARRRPGMPPGEIGTTLAAMRVAEERDEVIRLACEGAMTVGRCAAFLAVRRDVIVGREAVGGGLTREGIRNLWIPTGSPSILQRVLHQGEAHRGPHGTTPADMLFRAAISSRGGDVIVQPIVLSGKTVAMLCVDDVRHGKVARDRIEVLAHALADAFKRIIVSGRAG